MQVIVDGLLTNYERSGQGKVVVILHGWGDRAAGLKKLQENLSENFTVIAPDLPGFGGTEPPEGDWDLEAYAKFVKNFLHKIDEEKIYALLGHSNGGAIAIRGLAENILNADKLILLASAGIRGQYKGRNLALRLVTKTGKILSAPLPKSARKKLQKNVYKTVGSDMLVAENLQGSFKKIVTDDVRPDAGRLQLPALLIYGEKDSATPPSYGQTFAQAIKNSRLEILPGAGHFVHLDNSAEVNKLIQEFLK